MRFLLALFLCLPVLARAQDPVTLFAPFMGVNTTDWQNRVVINGGPNPSPNTVQCMENLRLTLIAQGITNKIYSLCVFVPDSVIAAATPLFLHKGYPMWTNNFVIGDLSINGLKGDGTSKAMDTGITGQQAATNLNHQIGRGLTVVVSESATNQDCTTMGWQVPAGNLFQLIRVSSQGVDTWAYADNVGSQQLQTNDFARVGYFSGNLITNASGTNAVIYVASPLESHKTLASLIRLNAFAIPSTAVNLSVFAMNNGTNSHWSAQRLSVAMVHEGFTATESSNVWNALKACRECLGGGTGDPVHEWAKRVVDYGGAAVSTTTSNALRTFRQGLDTDALLYSIQALNAYAPDNLTAARMPLLWQAGSQAWGNVAFGSTNLTVNGLTGDGTTKYLTTGIFPFSLNWGGFSDTSAGISEIIYANPSIAAKVNLGAVGPAGFQFSLYAAATNALNLQFYCWTIATVNANFVIVPRQSNWSGYLSGNRTAGNAIALYGVTNSVFNILTNATGAQTGNNDNMTNSLFAHALANVAVPANISDQTVSFMAMHSGFTQTQSSNLWNRAKDMRNSFGGGNP